MAEGTESVLFSPFFLFFFFFFFFSFFFFVPSCRIYIRQPLQRPSAAFLSPLFFFFFFPSNWLHARARLPLGQGDDQHALAVSSAWPAVSPLLFPFSFFLFHRPARSFHSVLARTKKAGRRRAFLPPLFLPPSLFPFPLFFWCGFAVGFFFFQCLAQGESAEQKEHALPLSFSLPLRAALTGDPLSVEHRCCRAPHVTSTHRYPSFSPSFFFFPPLLRWDCCGNAFLRLSGCKARKSRFPRRSAPLPGGKVGGPYRAKVWVSPLSPFFFQQRKKGQSTGGPFFSSFAESWHRGIMDGHPFFFFLSFLSVNLYMLVQLGPQNKQAKAGSSSLFPPP